MYEKKGNNTVQAAWLAIGSLLSFGFSIASAAILSRYLTKEDYGTYKQVMYVYQTLLMAFTLGLPRAYSYFVPRVQIEKGKSIVGKLNLMFIGLGLLFSIVLFLGSGLIADILNNAKLDVSIKLFALTPLFLLPTMGLEGVLACFQKSKLYAIYLLITRIMTVLFVAFPVMFYKADCNTAVIGFSISSFISCLISFSLMRNPFKRVRGVPSEITYREIFSFSIPLMLASWWGVLIKSADQFYISRFFGEAAFAEYTNGSFELPIVPMVLGAGATVLLPLFSEYALDLIGNKEKIIQLWKNTLKKSTFILFPLVSYSWVFATLIMTLLYGEKYPNSGIFFSIFLIKDFFSITQYYPIMIAIGENKFYAKGHMMVAAYIWILEAVSIYVYPSPYVIAVISVSGSLIKIFMFSFRIAKKMNVSIIDLFPVKEMFLCATSCIFVAYVCKQILWLLPDYLTSVKLIALIISFSIFAPLVVFSGKIVNIDYWSVFQPLMNRILKKCK